MGAITCCLCEAQQSGFKSSLTVKIGSKEFSLCAECSDLFEDIRDKHYKKDVSGQIEKLKSRINYPDYTDELFAKYIDVYLDSNGKTEEEIKERINSIREVQIKVDDEENERIKEEKERLKEENLQKRRKLDERYKTMLLTNGFGFEGYKITEYLGVYDAEALVGTGMLSEFSSGVNDFFGSESVMMRAKLSKVKKKALDRLKDIAVDLDANAIIGINYDLLTLSHNNTIVVSVNGTLVKVEKL